MGIEKFHSWLKNTYYNSISEYNTNPYDHVYIDLNFVLHRLVSYVSSEDELLVRVLREITFTITNNKPLKTLNLAADGAANYAKIMLQKRRRIQSSQSMSAKLHNKSNTINPLYLTPGTEFMNKFNKAIRNYVKTLPELGFNIDVNMDLSDEPDESEFKICRFIRKNAFMSKTSHLYDSHLILSNDADIVLIAMAQKDIYGLNVIVKFNQENTYIISIDSLMGQHMESYGYNLLKRQDFVFVSLLNGNDYFPKMRYSNFNKLWDAYKKSIADDETIVNGDGTINVKMMIKFLSSLISITQKQFSLNIKLRDICDPHVSEYIFGIQWCISLYESGDYPTYDYIYSGNSIHPASILLYILLNNKMSIDIQKQQCEKIPSKLYPILVLPYSAKHLIPNKYHSLLDNELNYMYDEEFCKKCAKFRDHLDCDDENCKYPMKYYILHRREHIVLNPKKYIDNILEKLR